MTTLPDSITVKVGQSLRHGEAKAEANKDNRPKRRDRTNGYVASESRVHSQTAAELAQDHREEQYFPNIQRKAGAEFFRAGQSDSDPISLGELKPQQPQVVLREEERPSPRPQIQETPRPRIVESEGKKTIFDELKDLDGGLFGEQVRDWQIHFQILL